MVEKFVEGDVGGIQMFKVLISSFLLEIAHFVMTTPSGEIGLIRFLVNGVKNVFLQQFLFEIFVLIIVIGGTIHKMRHVKVNVSNQMTFYVKSQGLV